MTNLQMMDGGFERESQKMIALTSRHSESWAQNKTATYVLIRCIGTKPILAAFPIIRWICHQYHQDLAFFPRLIGHFCIAAFN